MPLFNPTIIDNYTKGKIIIPPDHEKIVNMWSDYIQSNKIIRTKETALYDSFSQTILQKILGYRALVENPDNFTLAQHQAIGTGEVEYALGHFDNNKKIEIIAPFELKSAKTNLDTIIPGRNKTPVQQAWEYGMDAKGAKWILVSNYLEIRLYAIGQGRKDYEVFKLENLKNPQEYARFILILSADNLLGTRTLTLLNESDKKEKEITKEFYESYKKIRENLIREIKNDNKKVDFHKTIQYVQCILDRVLFIAFAEDQDLLPVDTIKNACTQNAFNPRPLWENFKGLFEAIDKGNTTLEIPGYNGGLFQTDQELNSLIVSDKACGYFKQLSEYNFRSEVSVKILGHILEQSIIDLEEIQIKTTESKLSHEKSKRKKEGVFYTPSFITRFIVEQAVGSWISDRKNKIGFNSLPRLDAKDYSSIKQNKNGKISYNNNIKLHINAWEEYKETLSKVKILDPACGSGAFLIEAFDYLFSEGQIINKELEKLKKGQSDLLRWDKHILANNLYGVDINNEAVEITKLALWLKTANKREKLTYLDGNIKCGDSLISDNTLIGDLAFDWKSNFPDIMNAGGFDIIIGNPPYGADIDNFLDYLKNKFPLTTKSYKDIYKIFFEQCLNHLLKSDGYLAFISPNTLLLQPRYEDLRDFILKYQIHTIVNLGLNVFESAVVPTCITIIQKNDKGCNVIDYKNFAVKNKFVDNLEIEKPIKINQDLYLNTPLHIFTSEVNDFTSPDFLKLSRIMELKDGGIKYQRIKIGLAKKGKSDLADRISYSGTQKHAEDHEFITGSNLDKDGWLLSKSDTMYLKHNYKKILKDNEIVYFNKRLFDITPKIIWRQTSSHFTGTILNSKIWFSNTVQAGYLKSEYEDKFDLKYILCLLMSKYLKYLYTNIVQEEGRVFPQVKLVKLGELPIFQASQHQQQKLVKLADILIDQKKIIHQSTFKFHQLLTSELRLKKISKNFSQWYNLTPESFLQEIAKQKIKLTLDQKDEWMTYFNKNKAKISDVLLNINHTENEINRIVYKLYNVTEDEIRQIELNNETASNQLH